MRAYDETITWLNFRLDLRQAPPSFWLLLGECVAGIRAITRVPLPLAAGKELERDTLAEGLHARLAMDGSSLTLEEVRSHLAGQLRVTQAKEHAVLELEGLFHTWQRIAGSGPGLPVVGSETLLSYHRALLETVPDVREKGRWRSAPKGPRAIDGVPPDVIPVFMAELCDWLNGPELDAPNLDERMAYALLHALIAELYLQWIQPFGTANARLSGTMEQHMLVRAGAGSMTGHLLSLHFHRQSHEYRRQVENAAQGVPDPIPFLAFGLRGLREGLSELRAKVREIQAQGQWRGHLSELFAGEDAAPARRQEQVLLDLAQQDATVPLSAIPALSPALARMYAGVSEKTLRRDVDHLEQLGTILRDPEGFRIRLERLLAFRY